jgi:hypothetical protein
MKEINRILIFNMLIISMMCVFVIYLKRNQIYLFQECVGKYVLKYVPYIHFQGLPTCENNMFSIAISLYYCLSTTLIVINFFYIFPKSFGKSIHLNGRNLVVFMIFISIAFAWISGFIEDFLNFKSIENGGIFGPIILALAISPTSLFFYIFVAAGASSNR